LTHRDKVLYPRDAITKADIAAYYRAIAPCLLPLLRDRPVVAQRWPDGIDDFTWYQHRVPPRAPDYLRAETIDGVRRLVIDNIEALLWMVNQAALTYHGFASRVGSLESPDWASIDLDPAPDTPWRDTVEIALAVRKTLELLELPSVVKTSGQKGIHVLVPLAPGHRIAEAEALSLGVAKLLCRLMPERVTLEMEREKRQGRLLLDYRQHDGKTLVLPYSLRAVDRAPVSAPLDWSEVTADLDPRVWNLRTMMDRVARWGDLAAPLLQGRAQLAPVLRRLA